MSFADSHSDSQVAAHMSRGQFLGRTSAAAMLAAGTPARLIASAAAEAGLPRNVRVSNDGYASHAETSLAVNPRDPRNLIGVCIVERSDASALATYVSFDGGASWHSNGALPSSANGRDPTVAFDVQGHVYVCGNTGAVQIWRSIDGGRSFDAPVALTAEKADHPWLVAEPEGQTLHVAWSTDHNTNLGYARSRDGGRSFDRPRRVAQGHGRLVATPAITAGSDGLVAAVYGAWPPTPPAAKEVRRPQIIAPIRVVASTDHGTTFADPVTIGLGAMEIWLPGGASGLGLPAIAADTRRGTLHAAYVVRPPAANYSVIVVRSSHDRGRTWTPAVQAMPGRANTFYFQPQLAVSSSTGRIVVSGFELVRGRIRVVAATSRPNSHQFSLHHISDHGFDPARGGLSGGRKHGAWWIGDYQGLAVTSEAVHPFWNDTRTGRLELFTATMPWT